MGIIIRQSFKGTVFSYLGMVIGYINMGIIMPHLFDTAQIGLIQIFAAISLIFAQFSTLGFTSVINRLFPVFRNKETHHHGFLFLALLTGLIGFIVSIIGFYILKPNIIESNIEKSPLLVEYLYLLMPLVFMRLMFTLLDNYNKVLFDSVTGTIWMEFWHKFLNLILALIFAIGWINFRQFFFGYIISVSIPVFPLIFVLIKRGEFHFKLFIDFLKPDLRKEILTVLIFGLINGMAGIIIFNLDKILINKFLTLGEVGIFGVCALFATIIKVPFNSISKISIGIIAESWKKNDTSHIQEIYYKSALNQAIIGFLILIGMLVNLDNIFSILPENYSSGKMVLVIYSLGILASTVTGIGGNITETSRYFKFSTVSLGISIVLLIGLSILLIPWLGITGAALATASTLTLISIIRVIFLKVKFGFFCFDRKIIILFLITLISFSVGFFFPKLNNLIIDILIRSILVTVVYGSLVFVFRLSPEMIQFFKQLKNSILQFYRDFRR